MRLSLLVLVQVLATCALYLAQDGNGAEMVPVIFKAARVRRTEGRITLEYEGKTQNLRHELAFSEVLDQDTKRSKVTIGFPTHEPSVYYTRGDTIVTKNKETGRYTRIGDDSTAPTFVTELDWFIRLTYTDEELRALLPTWKSHQVGPSGVLEMLIRNKFKYDHRERFRNINCVVQTAKYSRTKASSILLENFMPDLQFHETTDDVAFFTLRETALMVKVDPSNPASNQFNAVLTLDYFSTESIDKKDALQLEQLERDLSMPMGEGLSELLKPYVLDANSESFMMTVEELNDPEGRLTALAYDHQFNYLRKEAVGSSVSVWDLNEDLLYHVDLNFQGRLTNSMDIEVPLGECSVLSVEDERPRKEGAQEEGDSEPTNMDRPYKTRGSSLKLIEFLGARRLVYMGRSSVRDLPCAVFETVLPEAPKVFQLKLVHSPQLRAKTSSSPAKVPSATSESGNTKSEYDFIVQYFLLETSGHLDTQHLGLMASDNTQEQLNERFWPARINLYRRQKATGAIALVNSLEVHDFHLGLYGWTSKPSQLFMLPQCFDEKDEQMRVSLQLEFQTSKAEDVKQLALSKYKLEFDLMNALFRTLDLSRMHLTEYDFALQRPGQVAASFVISDRMQDKRVSYFGEGELPTSESYQNNRVELQTGQQYTTETCLMGASHIKDVSLVIHCPASDSGSAAVNNWPTCTAVFGETQPVVKLTKAGRARPCQAYLFEAREPPRSGVKSVESHKQELRDFEFKFATQGKDATSEGVTYMGRVRDFEVIRAQQLVTISNYRFALPEELASTGASGGDTAASTSDDTELAPPPAAAAAAADGSEASSGAAAQATQAVQVQQKRLRNVRHVSSVSYESVADCVRICNLDANCRSYSYCRGDGGAKPKEQHRWDRAAAIPETSRDMKAAEAAASAAVRCVLSSLDLRANNVDKQLMNGRVDTTNNQIEVRDLELASRENPLGVFKLEMVSGCDVYERDIMSIFTQTEELVRVSARTLERVPTATSVSECARRVVALEAKQANSFVGSSFAYCPQTQACLTDANLFGGSSIEPAASTNDKNGDDDDEDENAKGTSGSKQVACEMYRKRYQTYFHLSTKVVNRTSEEGGRLDNMGSINFIDLNLATVEECAHACWQSYGHVCVSFDYCSPGLCSLNIVDEKLTKSSQAAAAVDLSTLKYETRAGCLEYRRDMRWDQLRREHLIGSHQPLGVELRPGAHNRGRGIFLNLVLMCFSAVLFAAGLLVGRIFNDQLEIATSTWRSAPSDGGGSNSSAQTAGPFASSFGLRGERLTTNSKFNIENEIYEDPDAIRLEDFGGQNGSPAELQENDVGASELPAAAHTPPVPVERKPTNEQRRAGYMDIPDLL